MTTDIREFFNTHPEEDRQGDWLNSAEATDELVEQQETAARLSREQGIPYIAAVVIAGDLSQVERAKRWTEKGLDPRTAASFVGSYGRLDYVLWAVTNGYAERDWLLGNLPDLWRGSDPDDTDPRYLDLWREAKAENGGVYVADTTIVPLPVQPDGTVVIYRGQFNRLDPANGIAWSTDSAIAEKFARTGGLRGVINNRGRVHRGRIHVDNVLGWLTQRGESEVVVDLGKVVLS